MSEPTFSVIIPAYRADATLPLTLSALAPQLAALGGEAIVVESGTRELGSGRASPGGVRLLPQRLLPGEARNLGARRSRGELLVFLDADVVPEPDWLASLLGALVTGAAAVSGSVLNGTPASRWGTAQYVIEFLEWVPGRSEPPEHGASCNLLVRRDAFERAGRFPGDMRAGEDTVLTAPLAARGELVFAADARVTHLNRTEPRSMLAHQVALGESWVAVCRRVPVAGARLTSWPLTPVAVAGRLWAILKHSRRFGVSLPRPGELPFVLSGLLAWGWGVARAAWAVRGEDPSRA